MSDQTTSTVKLRDIGFRRKASASVAIIGNPNSGKSTLFNRLTGLRQTTGNYPGVTVEKHIGTVQLANSAISLIDLPGAYCLSGQSLDERIAVNVLLGRLPGQAQPDAILFVLDASQPYQGLYLLEHVLELGIPTLVALTMSDVAEANGLSTDVEALSRRLGGVPVVPVVATSSSGIAQICESLEALTQTESPQKPEPRSWPELSRAAEQLHQRIASRMERIDVIQALLNPDSDVAIELKEHAGSEPVDVVRRELFGAEPPQAVEARQRYRWIRALLADVQQQAPLIRQFRARMHRWINQPWPATAIFFIMMVLIFQAVFSWATPLMDAIDNGSGVLSSWVLESFGDGAFSSFLADGVIAGVGSVVIFLPQILILFLFIIVLEDSGYLARAAFLMDRVMRTVGLSGQSVIPMLSSFACAVPAIMATRVIPNRRDRIATIMAAPFMTCSARLPIYALLIAAFVPADDVGWFNLQGLVLFGLYLLGILGGLITARLLKSSALRGPKPTFMLSLPEFRWPNFQTVTIKLLDRAKVFLKRAGTVIFTVAVIVWALAYYPRLEPAEIIEPMSISEVNVELQQVTSAQQMSQSWLGRIGRWVEPVFRPLGWDWKVSSAVIAGFPAREVVVAVMGTLYAVGSDSDETRLTEKLRLATWPDGRAIFTLPMVLGLLVFYAWCLQCAATVAIIRRETNSWRWPVFAWLYMTAMGYLGALVIYQFGMVLLI
jgi:ferrous iron transport protein B